jgi:hypothetical protein
MFNMKKESLQPQRLLHEMSSDLLDDAGDAAIGLAVHVIGISAQQHHCG